jgi:hypothetical protein
MISYSVLQISCLREIATNVLKNITFCHKNINCCKAEELVDLTLKRFWQEDQEISKSCPIPITMKEEYRLAITIHVVEKLLKKSHLFHQCNLMLSLKNKVEEIQNTFLITLCYCVNQKKMLREINEVKITWNTIFVNDNCNSFLKSHRVQKLSTGHVTEIEYSNFKKCHILLINLASQDIDCLQYALMTHRN